MTIRCRYLALLAVSVLLLLAFGPGSGGARQARRGPGAAEPLPGTVPGPHRAGNARPAADLGLRPGDTLLFRFAQERKTTVEAAPDAGFGPSEPLRSCLALEGRFWLRVYEEARDGWHVGFELLEVSGTESLSGHAEPLTGLRDAAAGEVLAVLGRRGRLRALLFADNAPASVRALWKGLLNDWQLTLPARSEATEWEAAERDVVGTCVVRYRRTGPGEIVRTKLRYEEIRAAGDLGEPCEHELAGETRFELDPLPRLIEGHERLRLHVRAAGRVVTSEASFHFLREAREHDEAVVTLAAGRWARLHGSAATRLDEPEEPPVEEDVADPAGAVRAGLDELEARLAARSRPDAQAHRAVARLVELARRSSEAADAVATRLLEPACGGRAASLLAAALGAAGTRAAQEALVRVLELDARPARRRQALLGLLQVEVPLADVDAALVRVHAEGGDLAGNALLVLAAAGDKVRDREPKRFERIRKHVEAAFGPDLDEHQLTVALEAVGNLGPRAVHGAVRKAVSDDRPSIRAAALRALRRSPSSEADRLLAAAFREDPSDEVRRAAIDVLADRRRRGLCDTEALPVSVDDLLRQASEDPAPGVRDAARRALRLQG